jgi:hypothetical protein
MTSKFTDPTYSIRSSHLRIDARATRARERRLDRGHHAGRRDRLGEAVRQMSARRPAGALLVTIMAAVVLSACGGASSASSDVLDADSAASAAGSGAVTVSPLPGTPRSASLAGREPRCRMYM